MVSLNIQQGAVVGGNYAPPFGGGDGGGASCGASWLVRFLLNHLQRQLNNLLYW